MYYGFFYHGVPQDICMFCSHLGHCLTIFFLEKKTPKQLQPCFVQSPADRPPVVSVPWPPRTKKSTRTTLILWKPSNTTLKTNTITELCIGYLSSSNNKKWTHSHSTFYILHFYLYNTTLATANWQTNHCVRAHSLFYFYLRKINCTISFVPWFRFGCNEFNRVLEMQNNSCCPFFVLIKFWNVLIAQSHKSSQIFCFNFWAFLCVKI